MKGGGILFFWDCRRRSSWRQLNDGYIRARRVRASVWAEQTIAIADDTKEIHGLVR